MKVVSQEKLNGSAAIYTLQSEDKTFNVHLDTGVYSVNGRKPENVTMDEIKEVIIEHVLREGFSDRDSEYLADLASSIRKNEKPTTETLFIIRAIEDLANQAFFREHLEYQANEGPYGQNI